MPKLPEGLWSWTKGLLKDPSRCKLIWHGKILLRNEENQGHVTAANSIGLTEQPLPRRRQSPSNLQTRQAGKCFVNWARHVRLMLVPHSSFRSWRHGRRCHVKDELPPLKWYNTLLFESMQPTPLTDGLENEGKESHAHLENDRRKYS
ncbi:Chromobox protein2 [Manis javanica]|nr:Chromobox protein2 [Manis javanica]